MVRPTRVALALGSGGARGYAHIGVIEVLEERGYEIVSIAGTSMGAVVGGLRAAGRLTPYTDWVRGLTARQVVRLLDPSLKAPGAIRAEKILAKVSQLLDGALIEAVAIPFTAVATDLITGKEVWFQEGPLDAAIRASIALPTVITPVMINGRLLADGGLTNPIPTSATATVHADVTVAVSLAGADRQLESGSPSSESADARPAEEWLDRFRRSATQVLDRDIVRTIIGRADGRRAAEPEASDDGVPEESEQLLEAAAAAAFEHAPPGLGLLGVVDLSLEAMQNLVTRYRLAAYPPDLLITISRTACRTLDFHRANEMIELGRRATMEALDHDDSFSPPTTAAHGH